MHTHIELSTGLRSEDSSRTNPVINDFTERDAHLPSVTFLISPNFYLVHQVVRVPHRTRFLFLPPPHDQPSASSQPFPAHPLIPSLPDGGERKLTSNLLQPTPSTLFQSNMRTPLVVVTEIPEASHPELQNFHDFRIPFTFPRNLWRRVKYLLHRISPSNSTSRSTVRMDA